MNHESNESNSGFRDSNSRNLNSRYSSPFFLIQTIHEFFYEFSCGYFAHFWSQNFKDLGKKKRGAGGLVSAGNFSKTSAIFLTIHLEFMLIYRSIHEFYE